MKTHKIQVTGDGSHSLHSEKFDALYHSKHGAIQESLHVFIQSGLYNLYKEGESISIFEMGFGTGLNLLLTYIESVNNNIDIHYDSIEAYPIEVNTAQGLNYSSLLERPDLQEVFLGLHKSEWNTNIQVSSQFSYRKILGKLEEVDLSSRYDVVYFDAFAPLTQEELWTPEIFTKLAAHMNDSGVLVSYCAKGSFKRALQSAGFQIEKIPGPPGKREMIRGTLLGG